MHSNEHADSLLDIALGPASEHVLVVESLRPKAKVVGQVDASSVALYVDAAVLDEVWRHVTSDRSRELGGILVGRLQGDPEPYARITASLIARNTATTATSLTFTHQTWTDLLSTMDREYRGCQILVWYHSHPGHGVFLSRFDRFIQGGFFSNQWQCALVVDPLKEHHGLFCWAGDQITSTGYYLVGQAGAAAMCLPADESLELDHSECREPPEEVGPVGEDVHTFKLGHALRVQLRTYDVGAKLEVQWNEPGSRFSGNA